VSRLKLTFACGVYDRTDALRTGDVVAEGIDLNFLAIEAPREIFDRMGANQEFDVAEFSSSEFISRLARGGCPFVALPVFPARVFRHGYIYVNRKSGIAKAQDLAGKRIGVPLYTMTAAVWIRGHLVHQYGVDLSTIRWVEGAINESGRHGDPSAPALLKPARIEHDEKGRSLRDLLASGEIDAIAGSQRPLPHPDIAPLFPDSRAVERAYYRATRIFPIMHLIVIRRDVYEENPWIGNSLYKALDAAKAKALARLRKTGAHPYMLPWVHHDIEEINEVFGGDPFPYGIEPNRPTLEALVRYMAEQHFIPQPIPINELFVPIAAGGARVAKASDDPPETHASPTPLY
jgi:4,5-dihydroxyphthalate decarboxylase